MKNVVLIPDSFKGTMSSQQICDIMRAQILRHYPECAVVSVPVADGGEGSVDAFLSALGGEKIQLRVRGPHGEDVDSFYGILPDGTVVIEMAAAAGLPLVGERKDPEKTTTYGVGQLIAHAVETGCKKLVVGLGGSATNDLGCGAAAALGARFLNAVGDEFLPVGGTLGDIARIDISKVKQNLRGVEITTMYDIDNPLYGPNGAAYVFAPQKGADAAMVARLDDGLNHAAGVIERELGIGVADMPGGGAAGGTGAGMVAFLGAELKVGIETVLDTVGFDSLLERADLVLTGEGRIDAQTLSGKVVVGVARRAAPKNVPVVAIVGDIGDDIDAVYDLGVSAIFSINRVAVDFKLAKPRSADDLALTVDNLMRFYKSYGL